MNDRHPPGTGFPAEPASGFSYGAQDGAPDGPAYGSYDTGGYDTTGWDGQAPEAYGAYGGPSAPYGGYGDGDPLFGALPGSPETGTWAHTDPLAGAYGAPQDGYAPAAHDFQAGWPTDGYPAAPQQPGPEQPGHGFPVPDAGAQWAPGAHTGWDGAAYDTGHGTFDTPAYGSPAYDTGAYDTTGYDTGTYETGGYDATAWGSGSFDMSGVGSYGGEAPDAESHPTGPYGTEQYGSDPYGSEQPDTYAGAYGGDFGTDVPADASGAYGPDAYPADPYGEQYGTGGTEAAETAPTDDAAPYPADDPEAPDTPGAASGAPEAEPDPPAASRIPAPQGRGRRRSPKPRRSALLTVAAPSVCVLGVAGIAAASVGAPGEDEESPQAAAPDAAPAEKTAKADSKLDTQLATLSDNADDFADRASRTQERIDLKKRQEEERRRRAAEAARREALRPKFALPVEGFGISAYYGQAGINWMSVHSGIDFPASYGTPVKAATDGTVTTQWNSSYGNMMIVTAPDGTETWYCHLSSTRIRSGSVQAGDVIGYTGNSGNSTGPHLHFEVRPGGGSAIDPLPWFRSHGLEPG
ncbi:peptidoglycan DD-metalloendopeptidase family protein [Streptomyces sp. JJ36]|nr:peptidoglycan DD-metalloendopeptidase family protein [Streptomyces sp. JJ36]